ncbi:hypothetical protein N7513_012635 [Penicillium frequentans]|nr:hypothetical protein N7513_012635 [Penicillium glabrum]
MPYSNPSQHVSSGEERRAHNPEDPGSKPGHAKHSILFLLSENSNIRSLDSHATHTTTARAFNKKMWMFEGRPRSKL